MKNVFMLFSTLVLSSVIISQIIKGQKKKKLLDKVPAPSASAF
jgi:hypothetical protein